MIAFLLAVLVLLWLLGFINIQGVVVPNLALFVINGRVISLWDLLIFLVILVVVGVLPGPFRQIAAVLVLLWVLSILGILAFAGLSNLIVIAIIVGLIIYLLSGRYYHT